MLTYLLVDLECTGDGTSIQHDIIEIYAEVWRGGVKISSFYSQYKFSNSTIFQSGMNYRKALANKEANKSSSSSGITAFYKWLLEQKTKFVLVSYNAAYEQLHLKNWFKRNRIKLDLIYRNPVCVMTLVALRLDKYLSLSKACDALGIQYEQKKLHTAKYDVELLSKLFFKLKK